MNYYSFMILRYKKAMQPVRCVAAFLSILIPLLLFLIISRSYSSAIFQAGLLFTGWLTWTFTEYMLHRFRDHGHGDHARNKTVQMHHYHHSHPTEIEISGKQRAGLLLLSVASLGISYWLQNYFTFIAGVVLGFTWFIFMHYLLHQKWSVKFFPLLHRNHIYHHCKFPDSCHGISVVWWDFLFRTIPKKNLPISEKILAFYYKKRQLPLTAKKSH